MDGLTNFLRALGPARIIAMGAVTAGLIGFFLFLSMRLTAPQMGILYSGLELTETAEITERLKALQVPYQLLDNGRTIMAPNPRVLELRMEFASDGIGGTVGYELLDRQDTLGTTSFMQNVTHRRAIEGELARTIAALNTVREARVHLVMPERELFSRQQTQPTASVVLRTKGGTLSAQQVQAVQYLISSSVPGLEPNRVSIVDQNGTLLARTDDDSKSALVGSLHERQAAIENRLRDEVESLLAKTVGAGHVRAEVAVELEFEQTRRESEVFDPDTQVVVSQNTVERNSRDQDRDGGTVSVATNLPDAQQNQNTAPSKSSSSDETQETVNYENSRTHTTTVKEIGGVRRLSIAVLVDGSYTTADDGAVTYTPRSEQELEQLSRLVENAIGYDQARGDTVEVVNMRFAEVDEPEAAEVARTFFGLTRQDLERLLEILVLGIVSILVLLLIIRPIIKRILEAIPEAIESARTTASIGEEHRPALAPPDKRKITAELAQRAMEGDDEAMELLNEVRREHAQSPSSLGIETEIDVAQVEGRLKSSAIKKVGDIVARHPEESAAIIRQWLYSA